MVTAKEKLRRAIDALSEDEAKAALAFIAGRRSSDPVTDLFDSASADEEPSTSEEDTSADEAWEAYRRGDSAPLEEVRRELG
jgi:hypothetical protein